jgi:hypothetical protein
MGNNNLFPQSPGFRVRSLGSPTISLFAQGDFSDARQNLAEHVAVDGCIPTIGSPTTNDSADENGIEPRGKWHEGSP